MTARDRLLQALEVEPKQLWPEPLPLFRDPEAPEPFPLEALLKLEEVVRETQRIVGAPDALVAASYLAATSLAVQGLANVVLDGRVLPLSLYLLTVGESGERKTTSDFAATLPLREKQQELHLAQLKEITVWEGEMGVWEAARKRITNDKKMSQEAKRDAIRELGPPPPKPWSGIFLVSEPTFEGLIKLLVDGWPVVGLFAHEGGSFLGGHAMAPDRRLRTIAGLSEIWDGKPIDRARAGEGATLLFNRRATMHLLAQPLVARGLLGDALARDQGILSRFLVAEPKSTVGSRKYIEESVEDAYAHQAYSARLGLVWDRVEREALSKERDSRREGLPLRSVILKPAAKELWKGFYNHVEANLKGDLAPIRGFAGKLPEHALRLAGVLALYENPEVEEIGWEHVGAGISLAQFYGAEALRLVGGYRIPRPLARAQEVLGWIITRTQGRNPRMIHLAEIYQFGPPEVRSARAAREVLRLLEEHHYLAHRPSAEVEGVPRQDAWEVSPHAVPQISDSSIC